MTTPLHPRIALASLSARDRDGAIVVSLRGELDFLSSAVLRAYLSDIRRPERARCVVDLTGLTFLDCACLGVLVRDCKETRERGGSFALAGPQGTVRRLLSVTGLLTWFEVPGDDNAMPSVGLRMTMALAGPESQAVARDRKVSW